MICASSSPNRLVGWCVLLGMIGILLGGCTGSEHGDLQIYVEDVKARQKGRVPPLPDVKPFETFTYQAYALRDPFRKSHFESESYQALWPDAKEYLAALQAGAVSGLLDLSIINTFAYEDALARGLQAVMGGADPQESLDEVATDWDKITDKVGVDKQRAAYEEWASKPNAYPN